MMTLDPTQAILVREVHKRFGRGRRAVHALRGVSISVAPGEIYGLLGRNGAGKTTLVKILLDIVRATSGRAFLMDRPTRSSSARRRVGYLPEDHRFPGYQTGLRALAFYSALSSYSGSRTKRRFEELLDLVDLSEAKGRKIRSYSKGMKQRLGLAQALAHDPEILLLDEPTDGVDPVGRAKIRDILVRLKEEGKTIFLNSHLLSETERVCDRVGILDEGRIIREGTLDELTQVEQAFLLRTVPEADEALLRGIRQIVMDTELSGGELEVKVAKEDDIDRVVDYLRSQGVGIRALRAKRLSLEEAFLGIIGQKEGGVA